MRQPTDLPDDELLRRARDGDHAAFEVLVARHGSDLRRFAEARLPPELRPRVSVADVLQEAHIIALERGPEIDVRGESSVRKWLFKVVELKVKETVRLHLRAKRSFRREDACAREGAVPDVAGRQETPSAVASAAETAALARAALDALPDHYREVLRLARDEGLRLGDVAERTGRSREAVKKLYARALTQFAAELRRRGAMTRG